MRSGFFNSEITGYDEYGLPTFDRAEDAEFLSIVYSSFFSTGVYGNPSDAFQVSADEGMNVKVNPGRCLITGYFGIETEDTILELKNAGSSDRIDTVVLRLDLSTRVIELAVLTGTASSEPMAPELTRPAAGESGDIYEIGLANIYIARNSTSITNDLITDTRFDSDRCGIVVGTVKEIDFSTLTLQFQGFMEKYKSIIQNYTESEQEAFTTWFSTIRGILDEEAAGHLQNEIDAIGFPITTSQINSITDN